MLNEGFYSNANIKTPFKEIGDLICSTVQKIAETEASVRKYISNPEVVINDQYELTVTSGVDSSIKYTFNLRDIIHKIYNYVIDELDNHYVDTNRLDNSIWKDLNIVSIDKYFNQGFIIVNFRITKGSVILAINGNSYSRSIFVHDSSYEHLISTNPKEYSRYESYTFSRSKFKEKTIFSEPIKTNNISVCMDLRTYLTKAINGLKDGSLTQIQVKKSIEDYLKKL